MRGSRAAAASAKHTFRGPYSPRCGGCGYVEIPAAPWSLCRMAWGCPTLACISASLKAA